MKRKLLSVALTVAVGATLAACGSASSGGGTSAGSGPIKVGLIPPNTGALAQFGTDEIKGWQIAVDEVNASGGVDGRKVQLVVKPTDGQTSTTLQIARQLVTQNGVNFIGAVMTSPEASALNAQLSSLGALAFNATAKDDALVGADCTANSFHIVQTDTMDINGLARSLAKMPGQKWAIQAEDYQTGHTAASVFAKAAAAAGKKVVLTQFAPLNTTDFGTYITKLMNSGADALFSVEFGADGVAFVKQAEQFKLTSRLKTVLGFNMVSEPLFPILGNGVLGYYNNVGYDVHATNALNTKFVADYTKKYGTPPYYVPADNFLAAETLFAGITKAHSTDISKVSSALNNLTFDSIDGSVQVRGADHQVLRPSYVGQVVSQGGKLAFKLIASAPASVTSPSASTACHM